MGDTTATDPSGRPEFPAAFVTDTTSNPNATCGDWQQQTNNVTAISPSDVFGTWKAATKSGTSIKPGADPAKNDWNLGAGRRPGADDERQFPKNEGYGAEASWSFDEARPHRPDTRTGSSSWSTTATRTTPAATPVDACINVSVS